MTTHFCHFLCLPLIVVQFGNFLHKQLFSFSTCKSSSVNTYFQTLLLRNNLFSKANMLQKLKMLHFSLIFQPFPSVSSAPYVLSKVILCGCPSNFDNAIAVAPTKILLSKLFFLGCRDKENQMLPTRQNKEKGFLESVLSIQLPLVQLPLI